MKRNRTIQCSIIFSIFLMLGLQIITGCKTSDAELYSTGNALFFQNEEREDTLNVSFAHYPDKNVITAEFRLALIGKILDQEKEYKVKVVDSLTTATPDEYHLHKLIFRAGEIEDLFKVDLIKSDRMSTQEVKVVFEIEENENFRKGYFNKLTVQAVYHSIVRQPLWWGASIVRTYLGTFSQEKFEAFYRATGETSLENFEPWEKRKLCLDTKAYIAENGIIEADGSPMIIPCY